MPRLGFAYTINVAVFTFKMLLYLHLSRDHLLNVAVLNNCKLQNLIMCLFIRSLRKGVVFVNCFREAENNLKPNL